MKQLITRIDEALHSRLKERAADEGRSVNALVSEILEEALSAGSPRERFRRRLTQRGMLVELALPGPAPTLDEARELLRGDAGKAVLEALDEDRADRS